MKRKKQALASFSLFALLAPAFLFAQANDVSAAFLGIKEVLNTALYIAYTIVFLAFFWGILKFLSTSSEEKKKEAMHIMVVSVTIIFIMTSIWGIVKLLQNTLGLSGTTVNKIQVPTVYPK